MADNDIEYRVNVSSAQAALRSLEQAAANVGKTAAKGGKEASDALNQFNEVLKKTQGTFESVNDKAIQSNKRFLDSLEKRVTLEGKSGAARINADYDLMTKRIGTNAEQLNRLNKLRERSIELDRLQNASQGQGAGMLALRGARDLFEGRNAYGEVQLGKSVKSLYDSMGLLPAAAAGVTAAFIGMEIAGYKAAESVGKYGVEIHRLQLVTGLTAVQVQQVSYAAKASGVEVDVLERMMRGLTQAVEDDSVKGQKAREVLKGMGVDVVGLRMGTVSTMQAFTQLSTAFEKAPTVWSRNKEALDLLNRAGINSVAMMTDLNKHLKDAVGINFPGEEGIKQFVKIHDDLQKAGAVWDVFMLRVKSDLAQPFILTIKAVTNTAAVVHGANDIITSFLTPSVGPKVELTDKAAARVAAQKSSIDPSFTSTLAALNANNLDAMKVEATRLKTIYDEMRNSGGVDKEGNKITRAQLISAANAASQADARVKAQERYNSALESTTEALKKFHLQMDQLGISQKLPITKAQAAYNEFEHAHPNATLAQRTEAYEASLPAYKAEIQEIREKALDAGNAEMRKLGKELLEAPIKEHPDDRVFTLGLTQQRTQLEPEIKDLQAAYRESLSFEQEMSSGKGRIARTLGGKGDTIQAAQEMAAERKSILEEDLQFQLSTIDTVSQTQRMVDAETAKIKEKYVRDNAKVELELAEQVATRERQQLDSIKKDATALYTTLFEHPSKFPHQLATVAKTAALQPVIGGLSEMTARALHPLIFGENGTGGLAGASRSIFGGATVSDGALHVKVVGGGTTGGGTSGTSMLDVMLKTPASAASTSASTSGTIADLFPRWLTTFGPASTKGPLGSLPIGAPTGYSLGSAFSSLGSPGGGFAPFYASGGGGAGGTAYSSSVSDLPGGSYAFGGGMEGLSSAYNFGGGGGGGGGGYRAGGSTSSPLARGLLSTFGRSNFANLGPNFGIGQGTTNTQSVGLYGDTISDSATTFGSVLGSPGVAGTEMGVGLPLGLAGLTGVNRGTGRGIAEGAAGLGLVGASLGATYGAALGPLGIGIGAAAGAAAGLLVGGIEDLAGIQSDRTKAIQQVKQVYHISISNSTADEIAKIAQSKYGDNVSVAVRSPEVRQMLGLYAAGTGQAGKMPQSADIPMGGSLVSQGGVLQQSPVYQYGNPYTYSSSLPVSGGNAGGNLPNPGGSTIASASFNISGSSVSSFMNGEVFTPDATAEKVQTAYNNSAGRTQASMTIQDPTGIVG